MRYIPWHLLDDFQESNLNSIRWFAPADIQNELTVWKFLFEKIAESLLKASILWKPKIGIKIDVSKELFAYQDANRFFI